MSAAEMMTNANVNFIIVCSRGNKPFSMIHYMFVFVLVILGICITCTDRVSEKIYVCKKLFLESRNKK